MEVENNLFCSGKWSSKGPFSTSMLVLGSVDYLYEFRSVRFSEPALKQLKTSFLRL